MAIIEPVPAMACLITFGIVVASLNVLTLIVVLTSRSLRREVHTFPLISHLVANILIGAFALPAYGLKKGKLDSSHARTVICDVWRYMYFMSIHLSMISLVVMTLDKVVALRYPLHHNKIVTKKRMIICLVICWIAVIAYDTAPFFPIDTVDEDMCHYVPTKTWAVVMNVFTMCLPLPLILVSYIYMITLAVSHARMLTSQTTGHGKSKTPTRGRLTIQVQATRKVVYIVGSYLLFWGLSTIYYLLVWLCPDCFPKDFEPHDTWIRFFAKVLVMAHAFVSALLLCWDSAFFRRDAKKLANHLSSRVRNSSVFEGVSSFAAYSRKHSTVVTQGELSSAKNSRTVCIDLDTSYHVKSNQQEEHLSVFATIAEQKTQNKELQSPNDLSTDHCLLDSLSDSNSERSNKVYLDSLNTDCSLENSQEKLSTDCGAAPIPANKNELYYDSTKEVFSDSTSDKDVLLHAEEFAKNVILAAQERLVLDSLSKQLDTIEELDSYLADVEDLPNEDVASHSEQCASGLFMPHTSTHDCSVFDQAKLLTDLILSQAQNQLLAELLPVEEQSSLTDSEDENSRRLSHKPLKNTYSYHLSLDLQHSHTKNHNLHLMSPTEELEQESLANVICSSNTFDDTSFLENQTPIPAPSDYQQSQYFFHAHQLVQHVMETAKDIVSGQPKSRIDDDDEHFLDDVQRVSPSSTLASAAYDISADDSIKSSTNLENKQTGFTHHEHEEVPSEDMLAHHAKLFTQHILAHVRTHLLPHQSVSDSSS